MFEAIRSARDHINLETYIFEDDEVGQRFAAALLEKQARGVQVNVIYDSVGSIRTPREFFERMRAAGIRVLEFGPVNPLQVRHEYALTHRDHRKLLVVDGRVAFVGGLNISAVYSSSSRSGRGSGARKPKDMPWRDTHMRLEGPVVRDFQELFLDTWTRQKGDPLPSRRYFPELKTAGVHLVRAIGSNADDANNPMYLTLVSAVNNAESSIDATIAYFIPDAQLLEAIVGAAARGVKVTFVMPSRSDFWAPFNAGRARYETLLRAGVKIYERREALLHSKTIIIDDVWSTVGSTNLDPLSFLHNDEINAVVLGYEFAAQMRAMFRRDVERSTAVTLEQWRQRPLTDRIKEWAARLWEYWL
jgi:cardiolipin synthase